MEDLDLGVAYSTAETIDEQGRKTGIYSSIKPFDYEMLARRNHVDTCALIRREAIETVGGWDCGLSVGNWGDWALWLRMSRIGWRFQYHSSPVYDYRIHPQQMSRQAQAVDRPAIWSGCCHMAVVTPFSGRHWALPVIRESYRRIVWPQERLHLIAIDNGLDSEFSMKLEEMIKGTCDGWASTTIFRDGNRYIEGVSNSEAAGSKQLRIDHQEQLGRTMARLYGHIASRLLPPIVDFVFTIEDDIEIPPAADSLLLRAFEPDTMYVAGVVHSRMTKDAPVIAFTGTLEDPTQFSRIKEPLGSKPIAITSSGFGCTLHRSESWRKWMTPRCSVELQRWYWHDVAHLSGLARRGYLGYLAPWVQCRHYQSDGSWV